MQEREEKRQSNPKAVCDRLNSEPTFSWMNECFLGASNHHLSFKTEKHRNSLLSYSVLASFLLCSFETIDIRYEQKKTTHSPLLFGEDQCQSILLNSCQPELYLSNKLGWRILWFQSISNNHATLVHHHHFQNKAVVLGMMSSGSVLTIFVVSKQSNWEI